MKINLEIQKSTIFIVLMSALLGGILAASLAHIFLKDSPPPTAVHFSPGVAEGFKALAISPKQKEKFLGKDQAGFKEMLALLENNFINLTPDRRARVRGITHTQGMVWLCFKGLPPAPSKDASGKEIAPIPNIPIDDEYEMITTMQAVEAAAQKEAATDKK